MCCLGQPGPHLPRSHLWGLRLWEPQDRRWGDTALPFQGDSKRPLCGEAGVVSGLREPERQVSVFPAVKGPRQLGAQALLCPLPHSAPQFTV